MHHFALKQNIAATLFIKKCSEKERFELVLPLLGAFTVHVASLNLSSLRLHITLHRFDMDFDGSLQKCLTLLKFFE